jgi:hypothetical protein
VPESRDLMALNALVMKRSRVGRLAPVLCGGLFAGAFACAAGMTRWPGGVWWPIPVAAFIGFAAGWLLFHLFRGPLGKPAARLQAEIALRSARREGLLVAQRLELTAEGLRSSSSNGETLTRWVGVKDVARTHEHVVFWITSTVAFMAPRRAFPTQEAFEAFARQAAELHRRGAMKDVSAGSGDRSREPLGR